MEMTFLQEPLKALIEALPLGFIVVVFMYFVLKIYKDTISELKDSYLKTLEEVRKTHQTQMEESR